MLVTGASSGIGRATAEAFLAQGAFVAGQHRRAKSAMAGLLKAYGDRLLAVRADLSTEAGCVDAFKKSLAYRDGLDVVVHCAGIWNEGPIRELRRENLETMFRVNTFSAYYLAREAARSIRTGSLIFIGSTAGQRGEPGHGHYAGSKGAVQSLVYSIAQELAPAIRVNLISPGWVRTPMAARALEAREGAIVAAVPLRRVAEAEDVARAALFLASDVSRHLTGVDLCCSGGALLPMPRG